MLNIEFIAYLDSFITGWLISLAIYNNAWMLMKEHICIESYRRYHRKCSCPEILVSISDQSKCFLQVNINVTKLNKLDHATY